MSGWIKLHRKVREHWIFQEKRKFSRFEAWVDLLMMANHKDNKFLLGNELIEVNRGQLVTSELKLMERWRWGKSKLRDFLKLLEEDGMIVRKSDRKKTVITICNYNEYQDYDSENRPQTDHEQTNNGLLSDTNKNDKNVKNEKNNNYTSKIKDLLTLYSEQIPDFVELNKQYWDVIRETRKSGKIAESVIYNTMKKWQKYHPSVIRYALKTHIEMHAGKREEYTLGIMRNTSKEEAEDRLNRKNVVNFNRYKKASGGIDWEAFDVD